MNLKEHLEKQTYDKWYQNIEFIEFEGYAKSHKSWDNIKGLVDWKDKIVLDIGTFHGYFAFKAEQAGARFVTGIDKNPAVIYTTNMIADRNGSTRCKFICMDADEIDPHVDIILCLNVFHHLPYKVKFLQSLQKGQKMIMEVDKENRQLIEDYCDIITSKLSHRPSAYTGDTPNRLVLLVEKL